MQRQRQGDREHPVAGVAVVVGPGARRPSWCGGRRPSRRGPSGTASEADRQDAHEAVVHRAAQRARPPLRRSMSMARTSKRRPAERRWSSGLCALLPCWARMRPRARGQLLRRRAPSLGRRAAQRAPAVGLQSEPELVGLERPASSQRLTRWSRRARDGCGISAAGLGGELEDLLAHRLAALAVDHGVVLLADADHAALSAVDGDVLEVHAAPGRPVPVHAGRRANSAASLDGAVLPSPGTGPPCSASRGRSPRRRPTEGASENRSLHDAAAHGGQEASLDLPDVIDGSRVPRRCTSRP